VLVPRDNEKDVRDIPPLILKTVRLHFVEHMDDVLRAALVLSDPEAFLRPRPDDEPLAPPDAPAQPAGMVTH
jgi:ATP-dependent Lon protease